MVSVRVSYFAPASRLSGRKVCQGRAPANRADNKYNLNPPGLALPLRRNLAADCCTAHVTRGASAASCTLACGTTQLGVR